MSQKQQQQQQRHEPPPTPTPIAILLLLLLLALFLPPSSAIDLLFNGFAPSDLSLYANATLEPPPNATSAAELRRNYLSLSKPSAFTLGRALLPSPVPTKSTNSSSDSGSVLAFYASFVFSIAPVPGILPGHGLAFLFAPAAGTLGAVSSQHLGLFNMSTDGDPSSRVLAVEFDVFQNEEFNDINSNHVGVDYNSLTSIAAQPAGYWKDDNGGNATFVSLTLNDGSNYQAWVDYSGGRLNVTMAPAGTRKPRRPLISIETNLSDLFLDEMHVGFCASTGRLVERHRILAWSFSNSNSSASDGLITSNLPNFIPPPEFGSKSRRRVIASLVSAAGAVLLTSTLVAVILVVFHRRRKQQQGEEAIGFEETTEDWEKEYWPHRIAYQELLNATDGFSDRNLIACGGNGRVYKGVLAGGAEVAVKLFSQSNEEDETKHFVAEVSSLGRLKHRNLVGLRGWCRARRRDGSGDAMIIVYDFMENGSLDQRIFAASEPLDWATRMRILKDVAAAVLYLHEGWGEAVVLHRDIKASNVLLDGKMTGRLGDFGLARSHPRGRALGTTRVVGSAGYLAPEVVLTGRPTAASDVYALGVLALEMVSGRPAGDGRTPLVSWARATVDAGAPEAAVDMRARETEGFDEWQAERVVAVGLLCTSDDPALRPTMRQVVRLLEMDNETDEVGGAGGQGGESAKAAQSLDARLRTAPTAGPDKAVWGLVAARRREEKVERRHLTFEELRLSMSCSTSLSGSDLILEGR